MKSVASSLTLSLFVIATLYKLLNLNAWGVCVKYIFSLSKLNMLPSTLYFIESFGFIIGTTALFFF